MVRRRGSSTSSGPRRLLPGPRQLRLTDRFTQQGKQAAASNRAEHVQDGGHQRQRRTQAETKKGHIDDLEVLDSKNEDSCHKRDDDDQIKPAHGCLLLLPITTAAHVTMSMLRREGLS